MHNVAPFHISNLDIYDRTQDIKKRDFMGNLFKLGEEKCIEYLGSEIKTNKESFNFCRNEMMAATSCVLLNKVNYQMGDLRDNVGLCDHEINITKDNLRAKFESFPFKKMDNLMRDLSLSTKSFC